MSTRQRSLHLVQPQVVHTMHFNMRDSFMRVYYISGGCRIEFYQETTTMPSRAFSNQRATKVASWAFPHPTGQAFQDLESTMAQHAHSIANSILISSLIEYSILISLSLGTAPFWTPSCRTLANWLNALWLRTMSGKMQTRGLALLAYSSLAKCKASHTKQC